MYYEGHPLHLTDILGRTFEVGDTIAYPGDAHSLNFGQIYFINHNNGDIKVVKSNCKRVTIKQTFKAIIVEKHDNLTSIPSAYIVRFENPEEYLVQDRDTWGWHNEK